MRNVLSLAEKYLYRNAELLFTQVAVTPEVIVTVLILWRAFTEQTEITSSWRAAHCVKTKTSN
jgi:hypothetical protein